MSYIWLAMARKECVGCGNMVGVRTKECSDCGYKFLIRKRGPRPKQIDWTELKAGDTIKVVTSRSHTNNPKLDKFLKGYPNHELVKMGSSIKICLVADGTAHIYPRLGPTMEWDTAAAHAVVKYAGGNIYDLKNKNELIYNKSNLLNPEFLVYSN